MADVFISYAPADKPRVAPIAEALRARGFDVLWDYPTPDTNQALNALAVVAVWSQASAGAASQEANNGKDREALVPIFLDKVEAPVGYGHLKGEDLTGYPAPPADAAFERLVVALRKFKTPAPGPATPQTAISSTGGNGAGIGRYIAPALIAGGVLLGGYLLWPKGPADPGTDTPPPAQHEILGAAERYGLSDADFAGLPADALIRKALDHTTFETIDAAAAEDKLSLGLLCLARYYGGGTPRDDAGAAQSCTRAKAGGDAIATYVLSLMTRNGEGGIGADPAAADALLRAAADAGDPRAQHDMVIASRAAHPALARATAQKCAAQGNVDCRVVYAQMLAAGEGGARDLAAAKTAYDALEKEFHGPAIRELGKFYRDGVGVPARDLDEAVIRFKRAAVLDDGEASFLLGQMAEAGEGMPKSAEDALAFYRDAKTDGYVGADAAIARLAK